MPPRCLLLVGVALLVACGSSVSSERGSESTESARPAGWQSLDEADAQRLYYQFVDARGQVRFVESLDDVPEALRARVGFVKMASAPPLSPDDARRARAAQVGSGAGGSVASRAVLYAADWCGACRKAKRYLVERAVDFEERNIDVPRFAEELLRKTGERGIPVLEAGGRILTGFSEPLYDDLLGGA